MLIAGVCKSPHDNQGSTFDEKKAMTYDSLKAMADLLGPHRPILRTGGSLHKLFPTGTTTDFPVLNDDVPIGRMYEVRGDPVAWFTFVCGGCGQPQSVEVIYAKERDGGFAPLPLAIFAEAVNVN